ncbi:MAG: ATP-binding protein [Cyanobacteria bacterium J06628_3]
MLLLLDNYEAALFPHENYTEADIQTFVSNIRNLASHSFESQYLSTVVASSKRLNEIGPQLNPSASPWYNHYLFLSLKPFNDIEVSELLSRMPSELKLTTTLRQGIQEISGGIPVLVQNACFLIYNIWRSGQTLTVETFAEEFLRATVQIFQDWWTSFNETQQILLMLIALSQVEGHLSKSRQYDLSDIDIIFAQKKRELRDLEYGGFIKLVESSDKMVYQFTSSMMEWWVLTEIKNSGEEVINTRRKVFLSLMSHKQMQQIQNGIRWLQSNQDAVPSILTLKFPFDEK